MKRKCRNCKEWSKDCNPEKNPKCELKTMMIEQLVSPHKVGALLSVLGKLGYKFTPIGKNDFIIEPVGA